MAGIGERYQQETKYDRSSLGGNDVELPAPAPQFKQYPDAAAVLALAETLPARRADFWEVIQRRRSERDFSAATLPFAQLCRLISATQGITARLGSYLLRAAPSAGALYPVETYVYAHRVEDTPQGIYHLNIPKQSLELIRQGDASDALAAAALGQTMVATGSASFIWTGIIGRSAWKYRQRAYRYIYLDAGHIGQNLYLAATALKLGCCTIGAFFDDEVNDLLGVDGRQETVVYMGVVGTLME